MRNDIGRANDEAAQIATALYRQQLEAGVIKPKTCVKAMRSSAPYPRQALGDVVDLTTSTGRHEMLERLRDGNVDFIAKTAFGHIEIPQAPAAWRAVPPDPLREIIESAKLSARGYIEELKGRTP